MVTVILSPKGLEGSLPGLGKFGRKPSRPWKVWKENALLLLRDAQLKAEVTCFLPG